MAKYRFIKDFSTQITVGGINPFRTFSRKKGDVVEAEKVQPKPNERIIPSIKVLLTSTPIQGGQTHVEIPIEYVEKVSDENSTGDTTKGVLNKEVGGYPVKSIVLGVAIIAIAYYLIKRK